ncbi:Uncharacterised protein [Escherichia coli]|nr:hypothetical protein G960_04852 [Escherichia coli UMEA 3292-1]CTR72654.1 Uncharacterised protein [Escherichia coli]CTR87196.1 Uncharacterised protein [Escherichia coli]CTT79311.1 Uncharacterised protein [Escherichia coli]CTU11746.1 Uncharacterised protein [Escherichia coli]
MNAAAGIDSRFSVQGHKSMIFLVSALHASMVRRDLLCQGYGDDATSIICFSLVKRDAENAQQAPHVMHGLGLFINSLRKY